MKKFISLLLALIMVLGTLAPSASAFHGLDDMQKNPNEGYVVLEGRQEGDYTVIELPKDNFEFDLEGPMQTDGGDEYTFILDVAPIIDDFDKLEVNISNGSTFVKTITLTQAEPIIKERFDFVPTITYKNPNVVDDIAVYYKKPAGGYELKFAFSRIANTAVRAQWFTNTPRDIKNISFVFKNKTNVNVQSYFEKKEKTVTVLTSKNPYYLPVDFYDGFIVGGPTGTIDPKLLTISNDPDFDDYSTEINTTNYPEETVSGDKILIGTDLWYFYDITGSVRREGFQYNIREILKVTFNSNEGGKFTTGANDVTDPQEIGYGEKVSGNASGREITVPTATPLKTNYEFKGWALTADVDPIKNPELLINLDTYEFTQSETILYAIYNDRVNVTVELEDSSLGTTDPNSDNPIKVKTGSKWVDGETPADSVKPKAEALVTPNEGYAIAEWQYQNNPIAEGHEFTEDSTVTAILKEKVTDNPAPEDRKYYVAVTFKSDAEETTQNAGNFGGEEGDKIEVYTFYILKGVEWQDQAVKNRLQTLYVNDGFEFVKWISNPELAENMKDTSAPAGLTTGLPIATAKAGENFGGEGEQSAVTFTATYNQTEKTLHVTGGPAEGIKYATELPVDLKVEVGKDNWTEEIRNAAAAKLQLNDGYAIYKWTETDANGTLIEDDAEIYNGETVYAHVKKKATTEEPTTPEDKEAYVKVTFKSDAEETTQNAGNFGKDSEDNPIEEHSFWILKGTAWSDDSVQALVKTLVITDEKAYRFKEWTAEPALVDGKVVTTDGKTKGLPIDGAIAGTDFGQTTTQEVIFTATYTEEEVIEGTDPDDPERPGYTRVEFFADDVVKGDPDAEAKKGTLSSTVTDSANTEVKYLYYDIKEGLTFKKVPVPTITAKTGYTVKATGKEWKPVLPADTAILKNLTDKQFVGQYESANVIPYVPADPDNPVDPDDPNIPKEDEDGNPVDKDEYVIIGYKVEKTEEGDLKFTIKGEEKTGKAVSYLIKKDTLWSATEVQNTVPEPVALKTDTPFYKWDPALPTTDEAVVHESVFVAKFLKEVIEGEDPNDDVPDGYTRFKFYADEASKTGDPVKGTLTSTLDSTKTGKKYLHYDVKNVVTEGGVDKTSTFAKVPVPTIVAIDPNKVKAEPKNWDPQLPAETTEVTAADIAKEFVGQYESATVIPYVPKDPDNPVDPEDPNIPKEDEDGNKVDKDEYVIIGYKVDNKEEGDLKYTIKGEVKTGKAVSYLIKKGTKWSAPEVQGTKPEPVALKADAPFYKWDPALPATDEAVVDKSVFVAKFKGKIIEGEDPKDPVPEGYTRVEFFAEKAVKDDPNATPTKGTLTSTMDPTKTDKKYLYYDVKNGELFSTIPVPTIVAKAGSKVKAEPKNWGPILPTKEDPARDPKVEELADKEKAYVGQYDTGNVIPYEPTDPTDPTDPDDTNIPKEDEDGNPVDKDEYWIIGFNTDGNGKLKYTIKDVEKVGVAVSYLVKKVDDEGKAIKWNDTLIQGLYPTEFEPNPGFSFVKWDPKLKNEDVEIAAADKKIATANFKETVKEGDDPTAPIEDGYVRVAFWADKDRTGTERGTLDSTFAGSTKKGVVYLHYDVLENKEFSVVPVPTQTAKTGYALKDAPANWNPELYADNFKLVVKTDDPKKLYTFDSAYKEAGKVVPYVPANPEDPTNPDDSNVPTEDEDGNPINVEEYEIIAYNTDGNGMLKVKSTDAKWEKAIAYLIKKGTPWNDADVKATKPTEKNGRMKANEGYSFKDWTPNPDDSFALTNKVEEAGDKKFTANFVKAYFPYEPTDPSDPTNPDDPEVPKEDEDGKPIDETEYNIITAFVAEANGMLLDKDQANKPVKAVSWLVHKNAKWENLQSRIPGTQPNTDYRFAGWNPRIPGQGAVVNKSKYHALFEDDSAWKEPYYPDPRPSTPVIDKPAPRPDWPVIDEEEEEDVEIHELYILGMTDGTFAPTKNITRAEVAMIFARIMAGRTKFDKVDTIYPDVKADHWASGAIAYTTQMGIFEGRPDGTFGPQVNITRAEYATIVARYKGILSGTPRFSDVAGHWAENYIYACGDTGIVTGYTDGTFKPNNPIIRAEAVAMTNRMLNRKGDISFILTHLTPDMIFPDVDSSYWAFDHIYEASLTHEYIRNEDESETWIRILESGRVVQ